jgi:hypothetical protein
MQRAALLRSLTLALACVHAFPARRHLAAFFAMPSLSEGWKGFGAAIAVILYLLPVATQTRGLTALWRRKAYVLRIAGVVLAMAHAVPAADHLPRFLASWAFGDAWRGLGATCAMLWFVAPLTAQARVLAWLGRAARATSRAPAPTREVFDSK